MRERDTTDFWTFDDAGTCGPAAPVEHAALSPDDHWVAVAAGDTVRVVDPHDGRVALTVRGRAVTGLAWLSPELLLVLRTGERFGVRAVVHAIPDGGALASVALPEMNARTSALSTPAPSPDGAVSSVLVGPARWHGGDRTKLRRRLGYVLEGPTWEVASTFDPDAVEREAAEEVRRIRALGLVRMLARRPLELWLILDRAQSLVEAGWDVTVGTFCPREATPRNLLILARA